MSPAVPKAVSPATPVAGVAPVAAVSTAPVGQNGPQGNGTAAAASSTATPAGGTQKKRGRKPRIDPNDPRKAHPALNANEEGATTTPLDSVPTDYDEQKHLPLRRSDFKSEVTFLEWKADKLEDQAKELRGQAEKLKALGSVENQEDARKAIRLQKQLAELTATLGKKLSPEQLKALGIPV